MLATQAVAHLQDVSPEELMERGRNVAHKGGEMYHKVAEDERTQRAVATGKEKATEAVGKAKGAVNGGQNKPQRGDGRTGRFGKKSGKGSKDTGTKFQNPMLSRKSMSNPMNRSPSSSDKTASLLGSELTVAEDEGED